MTRRALLLAIADYVYLPPLGYVDEDIPRLRSSLINAGFDTNSIEMAGAGVDATPSPPLTSTTLRRRIRGFLRNSHAEDNLLVFLSGHGAEFQGRRIFLPQDYDVQEPESPDNLVSDSWIVQLVRQSPARSVLILIDACREGTRLELAADKSSGLSGIESDCPLYGELVPGTDGPTIAFLYGCAATEQSGIDQLDHVCSAFTRAVAEAFELERGPSELSLVVREAATRLKVYSRGRQRLTSSGQIGRGGGWETLVVREDEAARFRERLARSGWVSSLEQTELFRQVDRALPGFAIQLRAVAMRAGEQVAEAHRALPIHRWRDTDAWRRLIHRLYYVFLSSSEHGTLRPEEIAVLLAVPLVYETVLATVEARLASAGAVAEPEAISPSDYIVSAWRTAWREGNVARTYRSLVARGQTDTADDQICWALIQFCHTSGELWDTQETRQRRGGWVLESVLALLAPAPFSEVTNDRRIVDILSATRLVRLARLMFATFDDITLDTTADHMQLDPGAGAGEGTGQLTVNEVRLAHLLNLGAQLTLDARRLPPLVAEHLGTAAVPSAHDLVGWVSGAEWRQRETDGSATQQGERWFDLKLDCASDAVDAALLAAVDELESYRTRLLRRQDFHGEAICKFLPGGFTANRLNATQSSWHPTRPPLRFELDRGRIISLLMGRQLYGESWPALRELYQNALDACRYRRAQQALLQCDASACPDQSYRGRIDFRFGTGDNRRFVECVDNGIGMADRHVRRLFAYAGQRFADSHEFHIDRARWDEAGIPFFANSRFGIGVLSYFMLAEEVDLVSRRYEPTGIGSAPVRARILGTGSLFRVEPASDLSRLSDGYGTSVRLYLHKDAPSDSHLVESICDWLWLPEATTVIRPSAIGTIELTAAQPTEVFRRAKREVLLPVPTSESSAGVVRIFIAPCASRRFDILSPKKRDWRGRRVALLDGIATEIKYPTHEFEDTTESEDSIEDVVEEQLPHSLVVNLTEDFQAHPSVDRLSAVPTNETIREIMDRIELGGAAALTSWQAPDFIMLHRTLRELGPSVVTKISEALSSERHVAATAACELGKIAWPFSGAGLSDLDPSIALDIAVSRQPSALSRLNDIYRPGPVRWLLELSVRRQWDVFQATHPLVEAAILCRAKTLLEADLKFPEYLRLAVIFRAPVLNNAVPPCCLAILAAVQESRQVWLRDVLDWTSPRKIPLRAAMRTIADWQCGLLTFDDEHVDELGPLHKKLARVSAGNSLSWGDLVYFAAREDLPLDEVKLLARDLAQHGITVPDLEESCDGLTMTGEQKRLLKFYYRVIRRSNLRRRVSLKEVSQQIYYEENTSESEVRAILEPLRVWMQWGEDSIDPPDGLSQELLVLLSARFDGVEPFLSRLNLPHIFRAIKRGMFRDPKEVADVARSLDCCSIDMSLASHLDIETLACVRRLPTPAVECVCRLADATERRLPLAIWDFAVASEAARVEPAELSPILDFAERCGGDVTGCRDFLTYCAGQPR